MIRWLDRNQPAVLSLVMLLILATMYATGFLSASLATLEIGPVAAGALRVIFASIFLLIVAAVTGATLRGGAASVGGKEGGAHNGRTRGAAEVPAAVVVDRRRARTTVRPIMPAV